MEFIFEAHKKGEKDFWPAAGLAREILALDVSQQAAWMKAIGEVYRTVPKQDPSPMAPWHIGGRRLLDHVSILILRKDLEFLNLESGSPQVRETFDRELDKSTSLYNSGYDSRDLWIVIDEMQSYLNAFQSRLDDGPTNTIILGGSFINGKARLNQSDIDFSVSDPRMQKGLDALEERINSALQARHPEAAMKLEPHGLPLAFYGRINTFAIEIRPDSVHLAVFKPSRPRGIRDEMEVLKPKLLKLR